MTTNLRITKIVVQPDKMKKPAKDDYGLEVIHFKRALVDFEVEHDNERSSHHGILDFRSKMLTVTRKVGNFNTEILVDYLAELYYQHAGVVDAAPVDEIEKGRVLVYRVEGPDGFIGFIHFLKERGRIQIDESFLE